MASLRTADDTVEAPGLTSAEASRRRVRYGPNVVEDRATPAWRSFLSKFWGPIPWMLEAAAVLQLARGADIECAAIAALLVLNGTLAFVQEGRAGAALAALKERLAATALVRRDGAWARVPAAELVPGDVVGLALGALIPADATITSGSLMVDQSMLTGESVPAESAAGATVYAGSIVRRGGAMAEVSATGAATYFGRTAELVQLAHRVTTEQTAVFAATRNLAMINGAIGSVIVIGAMLAGWPVDDLIRLASTVLLATIPVALPATFTLSAALGAQQLARHGVLLTRLSAAHDAATMDVLCSDKTGTLTQNALRVVDVVAFGENDRVRVLTLAAFTAAAADSDPIDRAILTATGGGIPGRDTVVRFVPFDPSTKTAEAEVATPEGQEYRVVKGAFEAVNGIADTPADAASIADALARAGHRVIAVAEGVPPARMCMVGLVALSDPPRDDAARLIADLRAAGVRTVMVTGDSAATAATIAAEVGIAGAVCPPERSSDPNPEAFGVFARVLPESKFQLVRALQARGHVVGMCGDGVNDAPALRQAQVGVAVSSATDAAKAAAAMVLTEPGLAGVLAAVHEGRIGFQRLLTYTLNMMTKKFEIVLFLGAGLALTGHAVLTPALMVLMLVTNDFLAMSLTTDRASPSASPNRWHMPGISRAALVLGLCKLGFSMSVLATGKFVLRLDASELQTLALVTIVFGAQALLFVVRERQRLWSSRPSVWVLRACAVDVAIVCVLAVSGTLMARLPWSVIAGVLAAAVAFAFVLDRIKRPIMAAFEID